VIDDDRSDAEIDRLLNGISLGGGIPVTGEQAEVDAQRMGLPLRTRLIGAEEISLRDEAHERDLDIPLVEGGRRIRQAGCLRGPLTESMAPDSSRGRANRSFFIGLAS
jgi:hypothetical protein